MNDLSQYEESIKGNLCNLYTVLMALCDIKVKNQVKAWSGFKRY